MESDKDTEDGKGSENVEKVHGLSNAVIGPKTGKCRVEVSGEKLSNNDCNNLENGRVQSSDLTRSKTPNDNAGDLNSRLHSLESIDDKNENCKDKKKADDVLGCKQMPITSLSSSKRDEEVSQTPQMFLLADTDNGFPSVVVKSRPNESEDKIEAPGFDIETSASSLSTSLSRLLDGSGVEGSLSTEQDNESKKMQGENMIESEEIKEERIDDEAVVPTRKLRGNIEKKGVKRRTTKCKDLISETITAVIVAAEVKEKEESGLRRSRRSLRLKAGKKVSYYVNESELADEQEVVQKPEPPPTPPVSQKDVRSVTSAKGYKCYMCEFTSKSSIVLKQHREVCHGEKPFCCVVCPYSCKTKSDLTKHEQTHAPENKYKCPECDYAGKRLRYLKKHLRTHGGDAAFSCHICEYRCASKSALDSHLASHSKAKPFICMQCGLTFRLKTAYNKHLEVHSEVSPFICTVCGASFKKRGHLLKHESKHVIAPNDEEQEPSVKKESKDSELENNGGDDSFLKDNNMQHKVNRKRSKIKVKIVRSKGKKKRLIVEMESTPQLLHCESCSYSTTQKSLLRSHRRKHSDVKPHICHQCGASFKRRYHLTRHRLSHNADAPKFPCPHCPYATFRKHRLKVHIQTHQTNKPIKCLLCPYSCRHEWTLKYHMRKHTGNTAPGKSGQPAKIDFTCHLCGYQCKNTKNMKYHMMRHENKTPHTCPHCDYKCSSKSSIKDHLLQHAGLKPYLCSDCGKSFRNASRLSRHKLVHTDVKPYTCDYCDFSSRSKYNLRQHMLRHTDKDKVKRRVRSKTQSSSKLLENSSGSQVTKQAYQADIHSLLGQMGSNAYLDNTRPEISYCGQINTNTGVYHGAAGIPGQNNPLLGSMHKQQPFLSSHNMTPNKNIINKDSSLQNTRSPNTNAMYTNMDTNHDRFNSPSGSNTSNSNATNIGFHVNPNMGVFNPLVPDMDSSMPYNAYTHLPPPPPPPTHNPNFGSMDRGGGYGYVNPYFYNETVFPGYMGSNMNFYLGQGNMDSAHLNTGLDLRRHYDIHHTNTMSLVDPMKVVNPGRVVEDTGQVQEESVHTQEESVRTQAESADTGRAVNMSVVRGQAESAPSFPGVSEDIYSKIGRDSVISAKTLRNRPDMANPSMANFLPVNSNKVEEVAPSFDVMKVEPEEDMESDDDDDDEDDEDCDEDNKSGNNKSTAELNRKDSSDIPEKKASSPAKSVKSRNHASVPYTPFFCTECGHMCETRAILQRHRRTHLTEKPHTCEHCGKAFKRKDHMRAHLHTHSKEKPFKCCQCSYACNRKYRLRRHELSHLEERPCKCADCGKSYDTEEELADHMKLHEEGFMYACELGECEFKCKAKSELKEHSKVHQVFLCEKCSYSCTSASEFTSHKRMHHQEKKELVCTICGYLCDSNKRLKYHMARHENKTPHSCPHCDYKCSSRSSLTDHLLNHEGIKPFLCAICGMRFRNTSRLNRHKLVHSDIKPHSCDYCSFSSRSKYNLKQHMLRHFKNDLSSHVPRKKEHLVNSSVKHAMSASSLPPYRNDMGAHSSLQTELPPFPPPPLPHLRSDLLPHAPSFRSDISASLNSLRNDLIPHVSQPTV